MLGSVEGQSEAAGLVLPGETQDTILEPNPKCGDKMDNPATLDTQTQLQLKLVLSVMLYFLTSFTELVIHTVTRTISDNHK